MKMRVLIADDSPSVRGFVVKTLTDIVDNTVIEASDGVEAIKLVENSAAEFDIIFTDLHMPNRDGLQFISDLSDASFSGYVVVISNLEGRIVELAVDLVKAKKIKFLTFINKPLSEKDIDRCLALIKELPIKKNYNNDQMTSSELAEVFVDHEVEPYFQPQISYSTGELVGFEVLSRIHRDGEVITPNRFVPVLEENNLGHLLTRSLFEKTFPMLKELQSEFSIPCNFSFNISPKELERLDLVDFLLEMSEMYGIDHDKLTIEVTENQTLSSHLQLITLDRIRIHGFKVALDDFGTGYTNIGQLKNLPFSEIKLDRSMISGIYEDKVSQVLFRSMRDITELLGYDLVAEGVEDPRDLDFLHENSKHVIIQGFIFSKPKSIHDIKNWIKSWHAKRH